MISGQACCNFDKKINQKRIAFGYDRFNGRIVINEGQAAVVKLIYTWYAEGMSLGEIKKTLEGMFVPSP